MRISDWSSDVCSSDLLPRQATPDPVQLHLDRLLAEAGESGPTALPNVDPDLAELIASLSEKERRLLRFLANGLSNKDLSDRLSVSTNNVKRSEKHTSELQSLMRISYDVFCMKKTNVKLTILISWQI